MHIGYGQLSQVLQLDPVTMVATALHKRWQKHNTITTTQLPGTVVFSGQLQCFYAVPARRRHHVTWCTRCHRVATTTTTGSPPSVP
jgi:hypothetical protein